MRKYVCPVCKNNVQGNKSHACNQVSLFPHDCPADFATSWGESGLIEVIEHDVKLLNSVDGSKLYYCENCKMYMSMRRNNLALSFRLDGVSYTTYPTGGVVEKCPQLKAALDAMPFSKSRSYG